MNYHNLKTTRNFSSSKNINIHKQNSISALRVINYPIFSIFKQHLIDYPTPTNLTYFWGFGSIAAICLGIQIITGILLAMHYTPHVDLAFISVEHIMRDVVGGWLLRYIHANGASMFFIVVYIHMLRGLYYGSFTAPRAQLWLVGVAIFLLMMATAFMGYVLPWGQMSFWGATVITNLFSAIPLVGDSIVYWLWGGFSVDNATLNRFFSLHYLLPFAIAALAFLHMIALHQNGSNNPLGIMVGINKISFYPYFYLKDLVGWVAFGLFFSIFVYFAPNLLGHADNYIEANPMVTPAHIVPEWYFLPFYAILRSIPDKLGGVIAMFAAIIVLFLLPYLYPGKLRSAVFRRSYRKAFWILLVNCLILGWIGGNVVEFPYVQIGQFATIVYFSFFLIYLPIQGILENIIVYQNIHKPDNINS
uniref:Cytochrome b n=1 Tax=Cyanophora biloba TaxID=1489483 RepID=A0A873WRK5_9EUKA|nr:apocytochrome b [Cyanophora biloba]QPB15006.1 apocytochrome b [Cyanophora biloba]